MLRGLEKPPLLTSVSRGTTVTVNLFSAEPALAEQCRSGSHLLFTPGFRVSEQAVQTDYELWHYTAPLIEVEHLPEKGRVLLGGQPQALVEGEVVPYLLYGLLELAGACQGQATVHAAAVERNGTCCLLLGKAGAGKTSLALRLCMEYGFRLLANDLTVVAYEDDCTKALSGTQHFFMRQAVVSSLFPQLVHLVPAGADPARNPWDVRFSILPQSVGVQVASSDPIVTHAFAVHVIDTAAALSVEPLPPVWQGLFLHEWLSKYIRKVVLPTVLQWSPLTTLYNPSYDRPEFHEFREAIVADLCGRAQLTKLSGRLDDVARYVTEISGGGC